MKQEIEIKFKIENPGEIRESLRRLGAVFEGRVFERNVTFDNPDRGFGNEDKILRVREDSKVTITFKGPQDENSRFKKRLEIEVTTSDFEKSVMLLRELGFQEAWRYEKERETWRLGNVEIVIDRLPVIGYWIEIEGEEGEIEKVAEKLGLDISQGTNKTYKRIFLDFCRENGIEKEHMVF
ncbi:MAG TPA: class IV adenylate cyclase [Candidatus Aenigmarchaeota archaeon]|nr:class IV adenylate cyclase [Candidatus Aenigmarchaeota archaeon]